MAEMSKEEWAEKDRRIVKQSMLKAAVEWVKNDSTANTDEVIAVADVFVAWVYDEPPGDKHTALSEQSTTVSDISCPKPTLDQQKALDKVLAETSWNAAQVYARFSKFPVMSNVDVCIQKIKES